VTAKSSVAQPAVVFGGDFNCNPLQWVTCFEHNMNTQAARRTVQACLSKAIPLPGDSALAMNVQAFQEDSRFGKSWDKFAFSDAHDVVLVPLSLCNKGTHSRAAQPAPYASMNPDSEAGQPAGPMPTRPIPGAACTNTAQPEELEQLEQPEANRDSSAAQPAPHASMNPDSEAVQPAWPMPARPIPGAACTNTTQPEELQQPYQPETNKDSSTAQSASSTFSAKVELPPSSLGTSQSEPYASMCIDVDGLPTDDFEAAEPGNDDANAVEASSLAIPTISTPLYGQLLEKLANTNDAGIMESLANLCLFGKLNYKPPTGSAAQPADDMTRPYSLSMRIENLLAKTNHQRQLHINTLTARHDPRAQRGDSLIFNDADMKEVLNR
jgi:hypothetical protein